MESLQPIVVEEIEQKTIEGTVEPYSAPLTSPNNIKNRYEIKRNGIPSSIYLEGKAREAKEAESPKIKRSRMKSKTFFNTDKTLTSHITLFHQHGFCMWK